MLRGSAKLRQARRARFVAGGGRIIGGIEALAMSAYSWLLALCSLLSSRLNMTLEGDRVPYSWKIEDLSGLEFATYRIKLYINKCIHFYSIVIKNI